MLKAVPKLPKRISDPKYLDWLREQPCFICRKLAGTVHHENPVGHSVMGRKPCDTRAIPLCPKCHNMGERNRHNTGREFYGEKDVEGEIINLRFRYRGETGRKVGE